MTIAFDVLTATRARIDHPSKWAKGFFEAPGKECLVRALERAAGDKRVGEAYLALKRAAQAINGPARMLGDESLSTWQDRAAVTHEILLAVIDAAIRAEAH